MAGDTYTILLSGQDSAGRFCRIGMHIPHRHHFEEAFLVLEGEIELTFREESTVARTGEAVNVPANAPHRFQNVSDAPARLLGICSPAGQDDLFLALGQPVASRTTPPAPLDDAERDDLRIRSRALAPTYRTKLLLP